MLESLVVPDAAPGAVAAASVDGRPWLVEAAGRLGVDPGSPAVTPETLYDLASVSKVVTSAGILALVADGSLALDDRVDRFLACGDERLGRLTVRELLTHTAGLPSVPELHRAHPDPAALEAALRAVAPVAAPGTMVLYTSLGYQYLGWIARAVTGLALDAFLTEAVLGPCGVRRARFLPPESWRPHIAPTGWSDARRRVLQGEVHDENASILGGLEGHTGLFADAEDVLRIGEALLDGAWLGPARDCLFTDLTGGLRPLRSAAFLGDDPQAGRRTSWSHTGYTGTSIRLTPDDGRVVVLLTNRVHPRRGNDRIAGARRAVHDAVDARLTTMTTARIR